MGFEKIWIGVQTRNLQRKDTKRFWSRFPFRSSFDPVQLVGDSIAFYKIGATNLGGANLDNATKECNYYVNLN